MYHRAIGLCVLALAFPATAHAGSICIDGSFLVSGESRQIEVYDNNANSSAGTYTMVGGQKTSVSGLQESGAGYLDVKYRNVTNGTSWTNSSLMHDGDCIRP